MSPTAVQFGAGNIGRGFLAELFHESGLEIVFVDVSPELLAAIETRGHYDITIVGRDATTVPIDGIRAVDGGDIGRVAGEIARADIVCTAVGAGALPYIAPALAAGLLARHRTAGRPVNILLCENLHDAAAVLREQVSQRLPSGERAAVLESTGFVQAVVSRMVPMQTAADRERDPLGIRVEAYKRLPVDASAVVGPMPTIVGVEPTYRFTAYVERKLYTHNCAHAVLGYLGHRAGYELGCDALEDEAIRNAVQRVMDETGEALVRRHGFTHEEQAAHHADLLSRFANRSLADTCRRLARDPIRKLAADDRLVGAARLCEAEGVEAAELTHAIACALHYRDPDDPSAAALAEMLAAKGLHETLWEVCSIGPSEPLARSIEKACVTVEAPK